MTAPRSARRATALLALVSTLGALALLEGAARVYLRVSPPPPGAPDWDADALAPPPAAPGTFRIFVYGGSTAAGTPLVEYSFARQLEFWLHQLAPQRAFQIVNYGAPGKPTEFARLELERTIGAHPDLVIVHSLHNEFLGWKAPSKGKRLRRELPARDLLAHVCDAALVALVVHEAPRRRPIGQVSGIGGEDQRHAVRARHRRDRSGLALERLDARAEVVALGIRRRDPHGQPELLDRPAPARRRDLAEHATHRARARAGAR